MEGLYNASGVALALFLVLAAVDGVYLHLWRYRLYARPASRSEHQLHTWSAGLFLLSLPTLMLWESGGCLLWAGVALLGIDLVVELLDMGIERRSRADLGGLSTFEYILHVVITSSRVAAVTLVLVARPAEAWAFDAPLVLGSLPSFASLVAWQALPGAALMTALHVWLCTPGGVARVEAWRQRRETRRAPARACCGTSCCAGQTA